jgi:geranylgeranyl reductase family protein
MPKRAAEIAIVGAGPAGAHLAALLASAGRDVLLFDPKGAWEKPCGGGVTSRALREFAFLLQTSGYPKKLIRRIRIVSPNRSEVMLEVDEPFAVYSRQVLNGLVLDRAIDAGAGFVRASVTGVQNDSDGWRLTCEAAEGTVEQFHARFLVGADGAASSTRRRLIGIFPKRDLALAFGYNVIDPRSDFSGAGGEAVVQFPVDFTGYLWAFPRPGVMNFGVASKLGERTSEELRLLLAEFVREHYSGRMPAPENTQFFGAKIPTLDAASWKELQTVGDGWALIGDAAGFCDPITGEGIYYALKSAEILAKSLAEASSGSYQDATADYEKKWRDEFGRELSRASQILPRFYRGYIFGQLFTDAMVRLSKFHRGTSKILLRALIGDQSYITLKQDLLRNAWRVL